jgi:hypothetical protein
MRVLNYKLGYEQIAIERVLLGMIAIRFGILWKPME